MPDQKTKKTPWFPGTVTPVRRGLYQRKVSTIGVRWAYWNGKFWGGFAMSKEHAVGNKNLLTGHPNEPWRGLASKPT